MSETVYLPWQEQQWRQLQQSVEQGRLPHALLLCGASGVGKHGFAIGFAQSLLCADRDSSGRPCGQCRHCHLMTSGHHPDFQWVRPEEGSKSGEIKIESIRNFTESASLTAHSSDYKVIAIEPAHRMTKAAANSLLKTLEEPTSGTVMLLLTDQASRLLPTIRSRCLSLLFRPPDREFAMSWLGDRVKHGDPELLLSLANGAPLKALALDDEVLLTSRGEMLTQFLALSEHRLDPVKLANHWSQFDFNLLMEWLTGWVIDLQRLKMSSVVPQLFNPDRSQALRKTADKMNSRIMQRYLDQLYAARGLADSNLNLQLTLEKLLIEWQTCTQQAA
jgi:DNA polymerase-3 subunit delta'